ncbi:MAG: hypothetical protein ABSG65_17820, partial [Bryobacteraceae bacterium]
MKPIAVCVLISYLGLCSRASGQSGTIATVAGGTAFGFPSNVTLALSAPLGNVTGIALDAQNNIYAADGGNHRVFMISPSGAIKTVAGGGSGGGGGTATSASLYGPRGIALDASGNLFIADTYFVWKVTPSGIITIAAGNGIEGFSGDGGPATSASLFYPGGVAVDASGNLFIADTGNNRVRMVSATGIITTVAGNGDVGFSGDGGPASSASLWSPGGVAVDAAGDLFIADSANFRIRKVSAGMITTVAGDGNFDFSGDGGQATAAGLTAGGVAVDASGNLFIAGSRIRKVSAGGIITTVAGDGDDGFSGDGGPATAASLFDPFGVAVDGSGNLFIADTSNDRIRQVSASGIITTVAGNGNFGFSGDGGPATAASLNQPTSVALNASGSLIFADSGNNRVRMVSASGIITTVAGDGSCCFSGDGGPATSASFRGPSGVAVDASGNLWIADSGNNLIRKVSASGIIATVVGNGIAGFSGDGGPATAASLWSPTGVAVDGSGNLWIADTYNSVIRKVSAAGIIATVAGNGTSGFSGDGGPATGASLSQPVGVAVDASGNLFIADTSNNRIRKVSASGIVTTVAGSGTQGFSGDGGPATAASLWQPGGIAVGASGDLIIADSGNNRVRMVSASGIISTVAGGGSAYPGDGGPATSASLYGPVGVVLDASGNLFIADSGNDRIREVSAPASTSLSVTASPTSLGFALIAGGSSSQQIGLASAAAVPWSASSSAGWITLTPSSGTAPGTISVAIAAASLQPGTYTGNITISNPLASPKQETVSVSLTVTAASLSAAPAALRFQSQQGASEQSQSLQIGGAAGTAWQATAATSSGGAWLSVSPLTGQIPASLTVLVNPAGEAPGDYLGSVTIQAPGATPASITVNVSLTVTVPGGQGGVITTVAMLGADGIAVDASGDLFVADSGSNRIWKVAAGDVITALAGNGTQGFSGDGGPAALAELNGPRGVAVDVHGNVFIADTANNRIREVSASGIITTLAGNSTYGYSGDGGPGSSALLDMPWGVAVDASGNLFFADWDNFAVREISASGIITTIAGGRGFDGPLGDGGPAASAELYLPQGVAVDGSGDLFIADTYDQRIREVSASGIITTVAGGGNPSSGLGDGGPATAALLVQPNGVAVDASGDIFIADTSDNRIRKVSATGIITTVAGNGTSGFSGDGGPAISAELSNPQGIAVDASGNLFIADTFNGRVREVSASTTAPAPAVPSNGVVDGAGFSARISGGGIGSIFGTNLAVATTAASSLPLQTELAGAIVTMNGIPVPLFFVSPLQINFQVPWELLSSPTAAFTVTTAGGTSPAITVRSSAAAPGIFTIGTANSATQGAIQIANSTTLVAPVGAIPGVDSRPAKAGDILTIYCSGLGAVTNTPADGAAAGSGGLSYVQSPVSVTVGGQTAPFLFAGLAPGFVGLNQVNVQLPTGL